MEDLSITIYTRAQPPDLTALLGASLEERHGLVRRTLDEWTDGTNRFNKPGEVFHIASMEDSTVGIWPQHRSIHRRSQGRED